MQNARAKARERKVSLEESVESVGVSDLSGSFASDGYESVASTMISERLNEIFDCVSFRMAVCHLCAV